MKKFILVLLLAIISSEIDIESQIFTRFQRFIKKYNKKYNSMNEYLARFNVFRQNIITNDQNGPINFNQGITKFSDLTHQEFARTYLNLNFNSMALLNLKPVTVKISNEAPEAFDWRSQGAVSDIKDQGSCGSCWAFATVANLEGLYAQEKGVIKTFSEQLLVDCDTEDSGCNGGLMEFSFEWLKGNGGIMYEKDYPYTGEKQACQQDSTKFADMKITGYVKLGDGSDTFTPVDEEEMKEFLYQTGPLAIALDATGLQFYQSGIADYGGWICDKDHINHAVTLVGYGVEGSTDYWIVKNSWGKDWGESGYFRMTRGKGTCGINYYVTSATVSF